MNVGCCKSHLEQLREAMRNSSGLSGMLDSYVATFGPEALNDSGLTVKEAFLIVTKANLPDLKVKAMQRMIALLSATRINVLEKEKEEADWLKCASLLLDEMLAFRGEIRQLASYKDAPKILEPLFNHSVLREPHGLDNILNALSVQRKVLSMVDKETAKQINCDMADNFLDGAIIAHRMDRCRN